MVALIGGGIIRRLVIPLDGKDEPPIEITARMQIFGRDFGVVTNPPLHRGKIVVPRWEDLETLVADRRLRHDFRWQAKHIRHQLVGTIYEAFRQTWHILAKYGLDLQTGEKSKMRAAGELARLLNLTVLGLRPGVNVNDVRRFTEDAVAGAAKLLGKPKKFSKQEALENLLALHSGADSRGRVNPGVAMARTRTAYARLRERLQDEIMRIDPHIEARQKSFVNMIQLAELYLAAVNDFLTLLLRRDGLRPLFDRSNAIAAHLEYCAQDLEEIDFNPYRHACLETVRDLREARDLIRHGKLDAETLKTIRRLLVKCRSAIAIKRLQVELERDIFRLTRLLQRGRFSTPGEGMNLRLMTLAAKLKGTHAQLIGIDESGFRRPVCREATKLVEEARTRVLSNERKDIEDMRELLKRASAAL